MKRAGAVILCLGLPLAAASGQAGCGGGTLGGNGGGPPSGIGGGIITSGLAGRGAGGIGPTPDGGGAAQGQGGFVGTGGRGPGGVTGTGGFGGEFGTGGRGPGCPYIDPGPPVCGATLCGNGRVDGCSTMPPPGCAVQTFSEECDGTDFGYDSCAARGFASGNLTCRPDCTVDAARCSPCVSGPSTLRCGPAPVASPDTTSFALAATDSEVAYAMLTHNYDTGIDLLWFTRLAENLEQTSSIVVDDTGQPGPLNEAGLYTIALAPLASGWVIAVCADPGIYIHRFDANGQDAGLTLVALAAYDGSCYTPPVLAARPGGEVLLVWQGPAGENATVIAADGRSLTTPQTIVTPELVVLDPPAAAWVGDAFYVGTTIFPQAQPGDYALDLRVTRITADGQAGPFGDHFSGFSGASSFAAGADDLRVVYAGVPPGGAPYDLGVIWQRIAPDGADLTPVALTPSPSYYSRARAVAFGDDTVVLLPSNLGQSLGLVRVGIDGTVVTPAHDVLAAPNYYFTAGEMVRRGPDAVIGWLTSDPTQPIGLARLTP